MWMSQTAGLLFGTNGRVKRIEGTIDVSPKDAGKQFEIRTLFLAKGDLQISSSSIQKIQ